GQRVPLLLGDAVEGVELASVVDALGSVDVDQVAADVGGHVRQEETGQIRQFDMLPDPAERYLPEEQLLKLGGRHQTTPRSLRRERTRRDGVEPDAVLAPLTGQRTSQAHDA